MVVIVSVAAAHAQPATVNISVWTQTLYRDLIAEVAISGPGGGLFLYPDPMTGPDLTDPDTALDGALAALGLPPSTRLGPTTSSLVGTDSTFGQIVDNGGAIFGVDYLGDPDDYFTWVAIGTESVNVRVDQITTEYAYYRLEASIRPSGPSAVPLPGAGLLLVGGLGALAAWRRRIV